MGLGGGRFLVAVLSESSCVWGAFSVCENCARCLLYIVSFNFPQLVGMITVPILQTRPLSSEPEGSQPTGIRGGI